MPEGSLNVDPPPDRPICIAILAVGGQGGGILTDWIVAVAASQGWHAQSTSVPGVAQRTGATVYYVEMMPARPGAAGGAAPVLALAPFPGEVDIVIAAELMEAGRAIQRGLVTPDRTALIASSHRAYAILEKAAPGDGTVAPAGVLDIASHSAKRFIHFDMEQEAQKNASVISAVLYGALAGADLLPFARADYEATIRAGGVGVESSLRAFAAGYARARAGQDAAAEAEPELPPAPPAGSIRAGGALLARVEEQFPAPARPMLRAGLDRLVDFQDIAYGAEYLDRVARFVPFDRSAGTLLTEAARQIAVAMCYDDVIRVADLKTRAARFERVRDEANATAGQIVYTTEFMHPRLEEVCGTLPAALGAAVERHPALGRALKRVVDRGWRVRSGTVTWFLVLYGLAGMRRFRRSTLRHGREQAHIEVWLGRVAAVAPADPDLALEMLKCRRLVKGYSDTHERGAGKFDRILAAASRLQTRPDAAAWVRRLREAALADEEGKALDGALATVESFLGERVGATEEG